MSPRFLKHILTHRTAGIRTVDITMCNIAVIVNMSVFRILGLQYPLMSDLGFLSRLNVPFDAWHARGF